MLSLTDRREGRSSGHPFRALGVTQCGVLTVARLWSLPLSSLSLPLSRVVGQVKARALHRVAPAYIPFAEGTRETGRATTGKSPSFAKPGAVVLIEPASFEERP